MVLRVDKGMSDATYGAYFLGIDWFEGSLVNPNQVVEDLAFYLFPSTFPELNQTVFMRNVFKVRWVAPVLSEASVCYMRFLPIRPLPLHIWSDPPACYLYGRRRFLPLSQRATATAWKSAVPFNCFARSTGKCAFVFPHIPHTPTYACVKSSARPLSLLSPRGARRKSSNGNIVYTIRIL